MQQEFIQQIINTIRENIEGLHTACPGTIVSFDTETGLATVKPEMKFKTPDGKTFDYPHISGVPVLMPQAMGQKATIAFPIKENDGCLIVIAEQSIDYWMYGQETNTNLPFDLTNAICIPGLFPVANATMKEACKNNSVIVDVKGTRIEVGEGNVSVRSSKITVDGDLTVNGVVRSKDGFVNFD